MMNPSQTLKPGSLANGLKIAVKTSLKSEKRKLHDVLALYEYSQLPTYDEMKENNQDNILTLMKAKHGIELAICICMYSEDKKMLKSTLAGVS
jgi:hypothetical protein